MKTDRRELKPGPGEIVEFDEPPRHTVIAFKLRELAERVEHDTLGPLTLNVFGEIFGKEFWELIVGTAPTMRERLVAIIAGNMAQRPLHVSDIAARSQELALALEAWLTRKPS